MENTSQNIPLFQQDIAYTSFNKAKTIQENEKKLYFTYNENNNRIKTKLVALNGTNETTLRTHYYLGNYEEITQGSNHFAINYIPASDGITAIVVTQNSQPSKTFFTYKDNLGSIVALTNENGDVIYKQNFDAWGKYRNPGDWTYSNITPPPSWLRGYTGHEHLPNFHLINMNGRMYAPLIARMLSPDNFVQDATFTQNFNRYSYVYNNPLKYNDPSGEFVVAPLIIGALVGFITGGMRAVINGKSFWYGSWRGTLVGSIGGILSYAGGGAFLANIAWGMIEGGITGGVDAALWGHNIGKGILYGAAIGGMFASISSGFEAYNNYNNGYGFRTNTGVIKNYIKSGEYNQAIDFTQQRYGLTGVSMSYDKDVMDFGVTNPRTGNVTIGKVAFKSPSLLKATIAHEYGHSALGRVLDEEGNFVSWRYPTGSYESRNPILYSDGPLGYAQEIYNAGRLKINLSAFKSNYLWSEWDRSIGGIRLFHLIPLRYNNTFVPINY